MKQVVINPRNSKGKVSKIKGINTEWMFGLHWAKEKIKVEEIDLEESARMGEITEGGKIFPLKEEDIARLSEQGRLSK